jgi:hypothetical protein
MAATDAIHLQFMTRAHDPDKNFVPLHGIGRKI